MNVEVLDIKGNKKEEITLSDGVFGIVPNLKVLAQYIRVYTTNQRQGTSKVKTRGEVSGGGKKPWKQKGTGRARQGSTRSPIWVHGGVAFGPTPKDWRLDLPKKMRALAMRSALSQKFANKTAVVLEQPALEKPSTKQMVEILANLNLQGRVLIVWKELDTAVIKSAANIVGVKTSFIGSMNAYDIIKAKKVVFIKDAVEVLDQRYTK